MKSIAFYTLGCKLNFSETSTISRQLKEKDFETVPFTSGADVYVLNTCSVTDNADKKCRKVVKEALSYNPTAKVVVIGCYAQLKPKEISEIPGVNMVLGAAEKFNLAQHMANIDFGSETLVLNQNIKETNIFVPGFSIGDRTRTFMKIQDGCDYFCTFCTIPLARGRSRSGSIAETIAQAQIIAKSDVKEVVLTGVNIGDFGVNNDENFYQLIQQLDKVEGIERFRISSIEPNLLSEEIINFVNHSERFAPHFHLPLQSGNDELLSRMRRKYPVELYTSRVDKINEQIENCCIGVDVIVGFPGETDARFEETYNYLNELNISYLHVFPYSERPNTGAVKLEESVPKHVRAERSKMLRNLSLKKKRQYYESQIGRTVKVLFEEKEQNERISGFSENYIKIEVPYDPLLINEIKEMQILGFNADGSMNAEELVSYSH
jgi:threonylcarbamoyladenosine tRNA methylthiotransferase MtaB